MPAMAVGARFIASMLERGVNALIGDPAEEARRSQVLFEELNKAQQGGTTIKEFGMQPQALEKQFGPDLAAFLIGREKTDAFKEAQQGKQQRIAIKQGLMDQLNAPNGTVEPGAGSDQFAQMMSTFAPGGSGAPQAAPPAAAAPQAPIAEGNSPRLSGPGIPPQLGATGNIANVERPNNVEVAQRLHALSPAEQSLVIGDYKYGDQVIRQSNIDLAKQTLEQVQIPGVAQEGQRIGIAQQNANTSARGVDLEAQNLSEKVREFDISKAEARKQLITDAIKTVAVTHPFATPIEQRRIAEHFAIGRPLPPKLANMPGFVKSSNGTAAARVYSDAFKNWNTVLNRPAAFVRDVAKNNKDANIDARQLPGLNDDQLVQQTQAARAVIRGTGRDATPTDVEKLVFGSGKFYSQERGGIRAVTFGELPPDVQTAMRARFDQVPDVGGAAATAAAGVSPDEFAQYLGARKYGAPAAAAPAQPVAPTAPSVPSAPAAPAAPGNTFDPQAQLQQIGAETARLKAGESPHPDIDAAIKRLAGSGAPDVRAAVEAYMAARQESSRQRVRRPLAQR